MKGCTKGTLAVAFLMVVSLPLLAEYLSVN